MEDQTPGSAPDSGDQAKAPATESREHMIPKARLDAEISKRRELESTLTGLVEEMRQEIPEQFRGIIPEGLSPAQTLAWMRKATTAGLFAGPAKDGPDSKRPSGKPSLDFDNLSPQAMMAHGYK